MKDSPTVNKGELIKALGPVDATCVVVGAIIGVGIFFAPGRVAALAGSEGLSLLAWGIGGAIALMGALTFAELGGLYPRTGGQYVILRDAFGPFVGFVFVFCNATAVQAGAIAIIGIVCAQNLGLAVRGAMPGTAAQTTMASAIIVGLLAANCIGVKWGARIQNATVFAKVGTLLAVTLLAGFVEARPSQAAAGGASELGPVGGVAAALVPVLFSYGGWQHALWIAGEVRKPRRDVPLSIIGGVLIVIVVYLSVSWAYLHLLGYEDVARTPTVAADAVAAVWPSAGKRVVAAAVALSAFGVLNAQFLTGPRLVYRMAVDGRFFRPFAHVSRRFSTPGPAIMLLGVMALSLLLAGGQNAVDRILTGAVLIDGLFFAMTGLALLVLRRKRADAVRPVRVPGYPLVPLVFVVGEIAVVIGAYSDPKVRTAAYIAVAWVIAAALCYLLLFRGGRTERDEDEAAGSPS